jgi:hypothetical protein
MVNGVMEPILELLWSHFGNYYRGYVTDRYLTSWSKSRNIIFGHLKAMESRSRPSDDKRGGKL